MRGWHADAQKNDPVTDHSISHRVEASSRAEIKQESDQEDESGP
jgi:hypothetical protein